MNLKEAKELNQGLQERSRRIEQLLFMAMSESGVILEHHSDADVRNLVSATEMRILEARVSVRKLIQLAKEQEQLIKDQSEREEEKALQAAIALVESSGLVVAKKEAQKAQKKTSWWNIKRWPK